MENQNELYHHGIIGMKWGVRRYQNKDGSLTPAGAKRYGVGNPNSRAKKSSREDAQEYKYNKPGESGWTGARKAITAHRLDRKLARSEKFNDKLMDSRDKNRSRIESRYDKKIEKGKDSSYYEAKKEYKVKSFDIGTKALKAAQKRYTKTIENYKNEKLKSFEDRAYKKNPKYKEAVKAYIKQNAYTMNYGQAYTLINYAAEYGSTNKGFQKELSNLDNLKKKYKSM